MTKSFSDFDKFGLEQFADKLTTYLQVESKFFDESFVLSLNSEFGSGKSTFFEMWIDKLKAGDKFKPVYINAWESDFHGDPLLAIVSRLLETVQTSSNAESIKETAGKLCKFGLSIGNDIVQKVTGVDIIKAGDYAESKVGETCFQLYRERQGLFEKLKAQLHSFTTEYKSPILIIIDELDRCKPNYAIEFLETINHLFDIKGLVFVIGVDKKQLASTAKALFGQDIIFDEYYRKFAQRNVNLPVKNQDIAKGFCEKLADEYLSPHAYEEKQLFSYFKYDRYLVQSISDICTCFALNARQVHEFFRISAHALSNTQENNGLLWGWSRGTFFVVAMSIKDRDFYNRLGRREVSLQKFTEFLKELSLFKGNESTSFNWAAFCYLLVFSGHPIADLEKEFQELGVWSPSGKENGDFQKNLQSATSRAFSEWSGNYEGDDAVFFKIYQMLEGLRTFENK